ncbi:hypothetical protein [Streptomyces sp. NPDC048489]|uniref:hypothetical protein n=1 Tax=Streptomyces sp. NPDC048489 TaxID=3154504 RepID=UPI0034217BBB
MLEQHNGKQAAILTRCKGFTVVTLPTELAHLRELLGNQLAQMKAHDVTLQPRTKHRNG